MLNRNILGLVVVAWPLALLAIGGEPRGNGADYWPQWRGPLATGAAPHGDPPIDWNEAKGKNIRWKTKIPGRGHSTPIVWDSVIFLTSAIPVGDPLPPRPSMAPGNHDNLPVTHRHRFAAFAIDRSSGKILWQRILYEALPHEQGHYTGSLASSSPVTDGGEDRPGAFRLPGIRNVYSSPVAAAGRVYVTDLEGATVVISSEEVPRLISRNHISEPVSASAAISGRQLFLRGESHLYCLEEGDQ